MSSLASQSSDLSTEETFISPSIRSGWLHLARELWNYRELFIALAGRDLRVRYKQTFLGVVWVVLQPLLTGGLLALIFSRFRNVGNQQELNGALFFLAALVPWTCFATGVANASTSVENSANLMSKVYFPRLVVPAAYVMGSVVDFLLSFCTLLIMAGFEGLPIGKLILLAPYLLVVQVLAAIGIGAALSSLNAQYRDVKYVVPFILQFGMLSSVLLRLSDWPPQAQFWLSFNPILMVIETYRTLLAGQTPSLLLMMQGTFTAVLVFLFGVWFFRRREASLVDVL